MTRWTDEQLTAIKTTGTNIIVSAGAGSGKTAVLTERIVDKIISGVNITDLVVLTFTNAAAFEMKNRVKNKLIDKINGGNNNLKEQLDYLEQASISTFDSFCLNLVKKYHFLLNIERDINIIDNILLNKEKTKIIDDTFNNLYENKNTNFLKLINTFTVKDDKQLKQIMIKLSDKMDVLYNKKEYLDNFINNFYNDSNIDNLIKKYVDIINNYKDSIKLDYIKLIDNIHNEYLEEFKNKVFECVNKLDGINNYNDYKKVIDLIKLPNLPRASKKIEQEEIDDLKNPYNNIKESIKSIKELCSYDDSLSIKNEINDTLSNVEAIIEIIKMYDRNLFEYKKTNNMFCFNDIFLLAIKLLEENEEIRNYYKDNINEIMIDEYQDTNDIGNYLISLISNNNVYMVGDVKQSIYGFRNANPSIFMEKYDNYSKNNNGFKIDLNKNFRSRSEVLNAINLIFESIMDLEIGGADYNAGHAMVFGNNTYTEFNKENNKLEILNYEKSKSYRSEEIEAFIIASDIKKKIDSSYQVMGKDNLRNIKYSDFCILIDRKTSFDLYKKIFTYLGIPLTIHKDEEFVYSDEIYVINSIFKIILSFKAREYYNKYFNHAFLSLVRSFVCDYKDSDIFSLFNDAKGTDIISCIKKENNLFYELYIKLKKIYNYSKNNTLTEILKEIYDTFNIYTKINSLGNVSVTSIKLDYLLDVIGNLESTGKGIEDVVDYFAYSLNNKQDITFSVNKSSEDSVNIMTIHKSKGLEYSICYYAGLSKSFSKEDIKDKFIFNQSYGLITPVFNEGIKETILKSIIKFDHNKVDVSEKIRLFYVALTRAKEKIIIVTSLDENDYTYEVTTSVKLKYKCFNDMLNSIKYKLTPYIIDTSYEVDKKYELNKSIKVKREEVNNNINYKSINIVKEKIENTRFSVNSMDIKNNNIEAGLKIHECLELIDFTNYESDFEKYNIDEFSRKKISKFINQEIFSNFKDCNIYKEYEFIVDEKHGIIDLLIEYKDYILIVDYKLKEIEKDYYKDQLNGYKSYIENIKEKKVKCILYSILDESYLEV